MPKKADFRENLEKLKSLFNAFSDKADIRTRLKEMLDPANPRTSSRLNLKEVDFVSAAFWLAESDDIFEPLKDYAKQLLLTKISHKGLGRQEAIDLMKAIESPQQQFSFDMSGAKGKGEKSKKAKKEEND